MTQKIKNKDLFHANFIDVDLKKLLDPKALTFGVCGLKTSLRQFGPKGNIKL